MYSTYLENLPMVGSPGQWSPCCSYVGASNVIQDSSPDRFVCADAGRRCRHDLARPASATDTKHANAALRLSLDVRFPDKYWGRAD
jgi:hypothetical protein